MLQQFLDRHLLLNDLLSTEHQLITALDQNSAQLIPIEGSVGQLPAKKQTLVQINKKLAIAEEGKRKDIAAEQSQLSNEKNFAVSLGEIRGRYSRGVSLSNFLRDYTADQAIASPLTNDAGCSAALFKIETAIDQLNTFLKSEEKDINAKFAAAAKEITGALAELKHAQNQLETRLNVKLHVYQFAFEQLGLKKPITSKDL